MNLLPEAVKTDTKIKKQWIRGNDTVKLTKKFGGAKLNIIKGDKIGCFVAVYDDNTSEFAVGWSLCNEKDLIKHDSFPKEIAEKTAFYRAQNILYSPDSDRVQNYKIPHSIQAQYNEMVEKCKRYYKDKEFKSLECVQQKFIH